MHPPIFTELLKKLVERIIIVPGLSKYNIEPIKLLSESQLFLKVFLVIKKLHLVFAFINITADFSNAKLY